MRSLMKVGLLTGSLFLGGTLGLPVQSNIAPSILPVAIAQEIPERTLTVTGTGTVNIPTTVTRVRLAVEVEGENAAEVQAEVAERSNAVVNLLRSRGVKRLQTTGIQLQPRYEQIQETRQLLGYIGTNSVAFQIETEQAGAVIDDAIRTGATRIDGVEFLASDREIEQAKLEALRLATLDAREQADAVLATLGLQAQSIHRIVINQQPSFRMQSNAILTEDVTSPVVGGDYTVQGQVTLEIRY